MVISYPVFTSNTSLARTIIIIILKIMQFPMEEFLCQCTRKYSDEDVFWGPITGDHEAELIKRMQEQRSKYLTELLLDKLQNEVKQERGAYQGREKAGGKFRTKPLESRSWRGILNATVGYTEGDQIRAFTCCGDYFTKPNNATNHIRRRHGVFAKDAGATLEGLSFKEYPRFVFKSRR